MNCMHKSMDYLQSICFCHSLQFMPNKRDLSDFLALGALKKAPNQRRMRLAECAYGIQYDSALTENGIELIWSAKW